MPQEWFSKAVRGIVCVVVLGCSAPGALAQIVTKTPPKFETLSSGATRWELAVGITTDIVGPYPAGYAADWAFSDPTGFPLRARYQRQLGNNPRYPYPFYPQTYNVFLADLDGHANVVVQTQRSACTAQIKNPRPLTASPQTFKLDGFRQLSVGLPACQAFGRDEARIEGELTLSADTDGNVTIQLALTSYNAMGQVVTAYQSDPQMVVNKMTPKAALADIEQKRVAAQKAEEAKVAAAEAEQKRQDRIRYLASRTLTGLDAKADAIIQQDAAHWNFWRYDAKSAINAKYLETDKGTGISVLYSEYTFNDGSQGSVRIKLAGSAVQCMEFWNEGVCRPLGQPTSSKLIGALLSDLVSGGGAGGAGGCNPHDGEGCTPQQIKDLNAAAFMNYQREQSGH